jgi:transposase
MEKSHFRKLSVAALNERRRQAVKLRLKGMKLLEVAKTVELSRMTVISAVRAYEEGGWSAVPVGRRGRKAGDGRRLTEAQETEIRKIICERTPDQLKLDFALWTRAAVGELVRQRFDIRLPVRTIGHYLKRWGFTPQKPIRRAYEQQPEAVQTWLNEEYPAIADRAKAEGAEIHWGDETGLRSDDFRGRGYAPKGQTPVTRVPSRRESFSLISTVTNKGKVRWMVYGGALNGKTLIRFLERLAKDAGRKVFLILDNLRVHHSKVVQAWLARHRETIELFFLPSYSPELNPDECLNADLKRAVTSRVPSRAKGHLRKVTLSHMHRLSKSPERVRKYFQHDPVKYAA